MTDSVRSPENRVDTVDDGKLAFVCIDHCHVHGYWAVSVRRGAHGERITPDKCCGSWKTWREWPIDASELRDAADWLDSPDWPVSLFNGARRPSPNSVSPTAGLPHEDSRRVDWLEAQLKRADIAHSVVVLGSWWSGKDRPDGFNANVGELIVDAQEWPTLREAIDDAMSSRGPQETP